MKLKNWLLETSLTQRILFGMVAGVLTGIFFGESTAHLKPISDIYLNSFQMMVVPYLMLSLMISIGQLSVQGAIRLTRYGLILMISFWILTLVLLYFLPLTFPKMQNASFFSYELIEAPKKLDLLNMFIPVNPFSSMTNAVIPAVVIFSLAIGVSLIGIANKSVLIENLQLLATAMLRVMLLVIKFSPIGVFAITAITAGTISTEDFQHLLVYFVSYYFLAGLLIFILLPIIVTHITPVSYRELMRSGKDGLVLAFFTSNPFMAMPLMSEQLNHLMRQKDMFCQDATSTVQALSPTVLTFPNPGKLLVLIFVPFAAWSGGEYFLQSDYAEMLIVGLFSVFASAQVVMPGLFDMLGVKQSYLNIFISSGVVTSNFGAMTSAMSLLSFNILGIMAMTGHLHFSPGRLLRCLAIIAFACVSSFFILRTILPFVVSDDYTKDESLRSMTLKESLPVIVTKELPPESSAGVSTLEQIRARGALRVGYIENRFPFTFTNTNNQLVGMDVELANDLAKALNVSALEFVQVSSGQVNSALVQGRIDVMMSMPYDMNSFEDLRYSKSYFDTVIGLVVKDEDLYKFKSVAQIRERGYLKVGLSTDDMGIAQLFKGRLKGVQVEFVEIKSIGDYFDNKYPDLDGMFMLASSASAWSILNPGFSVVVPQPTLLRLPVGIATHRLNEGLSNYINYWLSIVQANGAIDRAYAHWVLGKDVNKRVRRWSIKEDVLGW
ncbi:cation:dicarboxylase symporter family transporter [Orrella sp. NBD-18]|uniref:Cation:dicarboxylase symporter family transporter n=1 Tax=Sheuella amnicola TaxID=2707330 RepID=A0A6B2QXU2_9BURK|nr:cation:dicarboxylase symporter family transporter [Sheuella amnicola]NDY82802.1 cation:dicarboxylase symporter family transporter [Sheuella amnicola]HBI83146.1 hypothetical protein [Alcaligenaceae bacterium]